ncbi:hypothetical protein N0V91_001773 [Didymella pomorum]|jgi:hypothetical protein|uniref:Uncharacterized protein n=1 Tax=Didymella pomorum TaxID=749634 RepID=A0A9W8ZK25_9PLEO|nr:hypothetical protein N0V91_001773 [Didymella pomorum]
MGQLVIPHEDPDTPALETPTPVHFPKEDGLTWIDFHPEPSRTKPPLPQPDNASSPQWRRAADEIENLRARFIKQNRKGFHARCSNIDRSAVIAVYNEALIELEHTSNIDAIEIQLEAKKKVSTILDIRKAAPDDAVFYATGAFLSPLEPHYAQPRLDYYDRDNGDGHDAFYWTGIKRLKEWRKGGWPRVYPAKAIEREMRERPRMKLMTKLQINAELVRARTVDSLDWGAEVDADPDRPWR